MAPSPELGQPKAPDKAASETVVSTDQTTSDVDNDTTHANIGLKSATSDTTPSAIQPLAVSSSSLAAPQLINKDKQSTNSQEEAAVPQTGLPIKSSNDSVASAAATDIVAVVAAAQVRHTTFRLIQY